MGHGIRRGGLWLTRCGSWLLVVVTGLSLSLVAAEEPGTAATLASPTADEPAVETLIPWLLRQDEGLRGVPFAEVIHAATGHAIRPIDSADATDARVLK